MTKKMNFRIILPILALFSLVLFTGCEDDPTVIDFDQDINVTIQGIVYDKDGNTPLDSVKVTLANDSVFTNAEGVYEFRNKDAGSHLLKFSKNGYASMVQTVDTDGKEYTANALINTSPIFLYANTSVLQTALFISNGIENSPAANVPFKLVIGVAEIDRRIIVVTDDDVLTSIFFENNVIESETDANGQINLAGLPNIEMELIVDFVQGNRRYFLNRSNEPQNFNSTYSLSSDFIAEFLLTETNVVDDEGNGVEDFAADANIIFTFTDDIDASDEDNFIQLRKFNTTDREILTTNIISGNTLTIDPDGNSLDEDVNYTVQLFLTSVNGVSYSRNFSFTVEGQDLVLGKVNDFTIDNFQATVQNNTSVVRFQFDEVEDANSYQVFASYSQGSDEFIELNQFSQTAGEEVDELEFSVSFTSRFTAPEGFNGLFDNGASIDIKVRAVNGNVTGEFSDTFTVNAGDQGSDF